MGLIVFPATLKEANVYITEYHRHHKPVQGHRFSVGVRTGDGIIHGMCVVGRPVARGLDYTTNAEVTRLVTDGTKNACSILYAASARACTAMGFLRIQTYILEEELGTSLKASGWSFDTMTAGGDWASSKVYAEQGRRQDQPQGPKQRWHKILNVLPPIT